MILYIAGPMSGIPQFNFPAFYEAQKALEAQSYTVINPAELDPPEVQEAAWASGDGVLKGGMVGGHTWGMLLARDVQVVADQCDGLALLPGWSGSKGARLELMVAQLCNKPLYEYISGGLRPFHGKLQLLWPN